MRQCVFHLHLVVFLAFSSTQTCCAIDWKKFQDPDAILLTEAFAKPIAELPKTEKDAAVRQLQELLSSPSVEIQRRAALTLLRLGDKSGTPTMIKAFSSSAGRDRDNVVVAIRILKDKRAVPVLRQALKDESPYVRGIAVAALGELHAVEAFDAIVLLTQDKKRKRNAEELDCTQLPPAHLACYALGTLGDKRAIPELIRLLDDKELRSSARRALVELTGQDLGDDVKSWQTWWKSNHQKNVSSQIEKESTE